MQTARIATVFFQSLAANSTILHGSDSKKDSRSFVTANKESKFFYKEAQGKVFSFLVKAT